MLTYAKVGGPPDDWCGLRVLNEQGEEIDRVVEVNAAEGWLVRHKVKGGCLVVEGEHVATERIEGQFTIERAD